MRRWRMLGWAVLLAAVLLLLVPSVAWADNCGSLYDCWGTAAAAGAAAAGAGAVAAAGGALAGGGNGTKPGGEPGGEEGGVEH